MKRLGLWNIAFIVAAFCVAVAIASPAQTFRTVVNFSDTEGAYPTSPPSARNFKSLVSFDDTDGYEPQAVLVQATDGRFYGTTSYGGTSELFGNVFRITAQGNLTSLYSFCEQYNGHNCPDGAAPYAGLVQGSDGKFYGTTAEGGNGNQTDCGGIGCGTVFEVAASGKLTTIYSFCTQLNCSDGNYPMDALVQGPDGDFYGTTHGAGGEESAGTVFKITPKGMLTTLYSFCTKTNCTDGGLPYAGLIQATDGNFYGTTGGGGAKDGGTVFKITAKGKLTTLYSFCSKPGCTDGQVPQAGLVQGSDGSFYGTASRGGRQSANCIDGCGTVFRITAQGKFSTLHSFCSQMNCVDGLFPVAGLTQGTDGNFYGATAAGGAFLNCDYGTVGCGTIFKITPSGTLTTLHSFCAKSNCLDGDGPNAGLTQGTDGNFYGTTAGGGPYCFGLGGCGTVFSLSVGLGPFVETRPTSGKIGTPVVVLGNHLTGTTNVTFNGTPGSFKVVSNTEITTTVPSGATSGFVEVASPKKKLKSNVAFRVTK